MSTLYEMTGEYIDLLDMLEDPDCDPEAIEEALELLSGSIESKAEGYAKVIKELEYRASSLKAEIERLKTRKTFTEERIANMKESLMSTMKVMGKEKIKTDLFSFNVRKTAPSVIIDDVNEIPEEFLIPQPCQIDKKKLKDYLKEHEDISYAHLESRDSLTIR